MRNLYNIFHISTNTKYVKGDGDVKLEKMVEEVVERRMLELVGDYLKGDGDVMLEKMVEEVVERKMLELVGDRDNVSNIEDRYVACTKIKTCMAYYGYTFPSWA